MLLVARPPPRRTRPQALVRRAAPHQGGGLGRPEAPGHQHIGVADGGGARRVALHFLLLVSRVEEDVDLAARRRAARCRRLRTGPHRPGQQGLQGGGLVERLAAADRQPVGTPRQRLVPQPEQGRHRMGGAAERIPGVP
ncbi:hypothetical protein SANT12839_010200 [Streptomyces antimycoticus]|uniref:Uncharacterized protein n=1 Tax=Streptomyces antimycoticus TaxID=68175 RepID=A0A4D4K0G7_9ACTN|nr:hypothetical protein SANT12839_010200 [Streptomyces antimycoticus]